MLTTAPRRTMKMRGWKMVRDWLPSSLSSLGLSSAVRSELVNLLGSLSALRWTV